MTISIEESIQKLKAEIIAQDWRLSPARAGQLEAAFACLQQRFKNRKATHAMLIMAGSVLDYIRKKGGSPPETIDFLKEAMAHVVGLYEDLAYEPEKEDKIFRSLFSRFNKLKEKIKAHKKTELPPTATGTGHASPEPPATTVAAPEPPAPGLTVGAFETSSLASPETPPPAGAGAEPLLATPAETTAGTDLKRLIDDLKISLDKAGAVGTAIGQVLGELLLETPVAEQPGLKGTAPAAGPQAPATPEAAPPDQAPPAEPVSQTPARQKIKNCPATELTLFLVNDHRLAVLASSVSLSRQVKPAQLKSYLKSSSVPLKDFGGFMQKISSLVAGNLAKIKERQLKKLTLPIMVPQGLGLPETPDDNADSLLIISNGNWHGTIACSKIEQAPSLMIKFEKQLNGDIAGTGFLEDDSRIQLLDSMAILRREGFLLMA